MVGSEQVNSDACLIRLLEARAPEEYGRRTQIEHGGTGGWLVVESAPADPAAALAAFEAASRLMLASILAEPAGAFNGPPPTEPPDTAGAGLSDSGAPTPPAGGPDDGPMAPARPADPPRGGRPCPRCTGPGRNPYCPVCHGRGTLGG